MSTQATQSETVEVKDVRELSAMLTADALFGLMDYVLANTPLTPEAEIISVDLTWRAGSLTPHLSLMYIEHSKGGAA